MDDAYVAIPRDNSHSPVGGASAVSVDAFRQVILEKISGIGHIEADLNHPANDSISTDALLAIISQNTSRSLPGTSLKC